jgi:hypothetical protein
MFSQIKDLLDNNYSTEAKRPFVVNPLTLSVNSSIVVYLDDGMSITKNYEFCSKISAQVQKDLELSDFVVNADKSVWEPVQIIEWLGFGTVSVVGNVCFSVRF